MIRILLLPNTVCAGDGVVLRYTLTEHYRRLNWLDTPNRHMQQSGLIQPETQEI